MERVSIKQFAAERGFVVIGKAVRANVNGFPYITFSNGKENGAENIYFSKGGAEEVGEGQEVNKDLLGKFDIGYATNEAGEVRIKLVRKGGMLDLAALLD